MRIDDIGASSKIFEVYGREYFNISGIKIPVPLLPNFLFFKYIPPFKKWGVYREMTVHEWDEILTLLKKYHARITVAVTATWVERNGSLVPFHKKFPDEASALKKGLRDELIEVANHGLTHCVVGQHLPRLFSSNRKYHREFWDWLPEKLHQEHIKKSQEILESYFDTRVTTFIPPGNVFSKNTIKACKDNGIKLINCNTHARMLDGIKIISNDDIIDFHDREIVMYGLDWFRNLLEKHKDVEKTWVKNIAGYN